MHILRLASVWALRPSIKASITQDPNETDQEYIYRIKSLENLPFDKTIFEERAATKNILKFQNNLKELVRNEIIIGEIVRNYTSNPEIISRL